MIGHLIPGYPIGLAGATCPICKLPEVDRAGAPAMAAPKATRGEPERGTGAASGTLSVGGNFPCPRTEVSVEMVRLADLPRALGTASSAPLATAREGHNQMMSPRSTLALTVIALLAGPFVLMSAHARDNGQWAAVPNDVRMWFKGLTQPDDPTVSCCGEADAFEADSFEVVGDNYVAIITGGHGDFPTGSRILVPNNKLKWDKGNPTGHGIIFIGSAANVLCYVTPSGI
jgi:hypothetical protein